MNIYDIVHSKIISAIKHVAKQKSWTNLQLQNIITEIPHNSKYGDISTNAAMILAPQLKKSPLEIAKSLISEFEKDDMLLKVTFAGSGFINLVVKPYIWRHELFEILDKGDLYAKSNIGEGKIINIEYASPNPTGPMHIGHASGSIYGDVLASLLEYVGYKVTRECYINDAGNQINTVSKSIYWRYLELFKKIKASEKFPEDCYPGEYIIDAARSLKDQYGDKLIDKTQSEWQPIVREFAIEEMLKLVKKDLISLGIKHDIFFYETVLHKENKIQKLVNKLQDLDLVYEGTLESPKGQKDPDWKEKKLLLFKSTEYGDDQDRALQKSDGSWTYFAADAAYLAEKILRGFTELILIIGPDHMGYQKRMYAACAALNKGKCILDIKFSQFVVFLQNGKPLKMSKRTGNFVSIEQVLNLVGKDVLRFMMLTRKTNSVLEFDVEKVQEQSKDNPVFYVQYAHARGCSVLLNAEETANKAFKKAVEAWNKVNLNLLKTEIELDLIKYLSYWPRQIKIAALNNEPQKLVAYLQKLASKFHAFWNIGNEDQDLRFIIADNTELTAARLVLLQAVLKIISNALRLIGVTPLSNM